MAEIKFRVMNDEGSFVDMNSQKEETPVVENENVVEETQVQVNEQEVKEETVIESSQENVQENVQEDVHNDVQETVQKEDLDESRILKHLKERYDAQFETLDDVLRNSKKEEVLLPEDVQKYIEYKKETGRTMEDFLRIQKDLSNVDELTLLQEYYKETKPYLEAKDISEYVENNFGFDEEIDDKTKKKRELSYKEELYNAKKHFDTLKEKYRTPLESSAQSVPEEYQTAYEAYNNYINESEKTRTLTEERAKVFSEKTSELFSKNFEGFEYNVGDKKVVFKPKDVEAVKETQSNLNNYINRFLDKDGYLSDSDGFHRSLNMALNPDSVAKFFYEQGVADATDGIVKETKNIDMNVRTNKESEKKGGFQYRVLGDSDSFGLKIKKK